MAGRRWQTIGSAGFRKLNGGYSESTGTIEEVEETLAFLGGDIKVDKVFDKSNSGTIEKPLVTQMKMKAKAVAFAFNNAFINGNQGTNPDSFEGIMNRVGNMPSRMTQFLDTNANNTGTSLKVLANATNEKALITAMQKANKTVGGATAIYMNENTFIQIGAMMRDLGITYQPVELWDKVWESFQGVPFVDVGLLGDKSTEIILSTEGTDTVSTSMYFVRMDTDDGLQGIQLAGMDMNVYDPLNGNETEGGPQYLRRVDWACGLFNLSNYSIARVGGFKMAAS